MEPGPDRGRETVVTVLLGVWYEISDINGFYFLLGMVCMIVFFVLIIRILEYSLCRRHELTSKCTDRAGECEGRPPAFLLGAVSRVLLVITAE